MTFISTFLLLFFSFLATPVLHAEVVDRLVAIVNDDIITEGDVDKILAFHLSELKSLGSDLERSVRLKELRGQAIDELVQEKLLNRKVESSDVAISDQELSSTIARILSDNHLSLSEFKAELGKNGTTFDAYKDKLRSQMRQYRFIQRELEPKIHVADGDIADYYREHAAEFQSFGELRFSELLLSSKAPKNGKNPLDFARELQKKIVKNEISFAEAAKKYSEGPLAASGGDSGWLPSKDVNPELLRLLSSLKVKEISEPISAGDGILIVRLEGEKTPVLRPLEAVKKEIEDQLFKLKMDAALKEYVFSLRQGAYIQIMN